MQRREMLLAEAECHLMNSQHIYIRLFAVAALAAFVVPSPAGGQPKAPAPIRIQGCTNYLQLAEAEYKAIDGDLERLSKLKVERMTVLAQPSPQAVPVAPSGQPTAKPAVATPELAKVYETEIGKIEAGIKSKRKVLAAIEKVYRECIETPPKREAEAEPAQKKRRK